MITWYVVGSLWLAILGTNVVDPWTARIGSLLLLVALIALTVWYINQKRRDWMWTLLVLIPVIGWLIILALRDMGKGQLGNQQVSAEVTSSQKAESATTTPSPPQTKSLSKRIASLFIQSDD